MSVPTLVRLALASEGITDEAKIESWKIMPQLHSAVYAVKVKYTVDGELHSMRKDISLKEITEK